MLPDVHRAALRRGLPLLWSTALLATAGCALQPAAPAEPAPAVAADPSPAAEPVAPAASSPTEARAAREARAEARAEAAALRNGDNAGAAVPLPQGNVTLLAYADRVRSMAPGELSGEIARLSEQSDAQRAPFTDMQLALALGQNRGTQDTLRAQALLQRVVNNPSDEARRLQPLARLLLARYAEQRRLEEQLDRQGQQLRDSQRRIDQLNERLEAVRAIERSLTRTGNGNGGATPAAAPAARP